MFSAQHVYVIFLKHFFLVAALWGGIVLTR